MRPISSLAAIAVVLFLLGGCINATRDSTATVGQELLDLQKAHAGGAITDAEYQAKKPQVGDGTFRTELTH